VMYQGVDARGVGLGPKRDHQPAIAFFFLAFEIVGNFFILNLFIGIILDNFARISEEGGGGSNELLTSAQRKWVRMHNRMAKLTPNPVPTYPSDAYRYMACKVCEHPHFDNGIIICILLNTFFMALEHQGQGDAFTTVMETFNIFFTAIFTIEAAFKLYAFYPTEYFADRWNCFDFFVCALSIIGLATGAGGGAGVFRVLRLARIFKVAKQLRGLRMLFNTLVISLPSLANIGALLLLLCFVYAVLGVNLFGKVKYGEELNKNANFRNFGRAILTLLRMSTGEAFNSIMYDVMTQEDCDKSSDCAIGECCGVEFAPIYFISFVILGSFVTLNLLIAVVIDNFSNSKKEDAKEVTEEDLTVFREVWQQYDPDATFFIPESKLTHLILSVPPPLGLNGHNTVSKTAIMRFKNSLNMEVTSCMLHYQTVVQALVRKAMDIDMSEMPPSMVEALRRDLDVQRVRAELDYMSKAPGKDAVAMFQPFAGEEPRTAAHVHASEVVNARVRGFLHRKRQRQQREKDEQQEQLDVAHTITDHIQRLLQEAKVQVSEEDHREAR